MFRGREKETATERQRGGEREAARQLGLDHNDDDNNRRRHRATMITTRQLDRAHFCRPPVLMSLATRRFHIEPGWRLEGPRIANMFRCNGLIPLDRRACARLRRKSASAFCLISKSLRQRRERFFKGLHISFPSASFDFASALV